MVSIIVPTGTPALLQCLVNTLFYLTGLMHQFSVHSPMQGHDPFNILTHVFIMLSVYPTESGWSLTD